MAVEDPGPFYHGTKADLQPGDLLQAGYRSNFGEGRKANFVYLTATLDAATWGAELSAGDGPGRIYEVAPTGPGCLPPTATVPLSRTPRAIADRTASWSHTNPKQVSVAPDSCRARRRWVPSASLSERGCGTGS